MDRHDAASLDWVVAMVGDADVDPVSPHQRRGVAHLLVELGLGGGRRLVEPGQPSDPSCQWEPTRGSHTSTRAHEQEVPHATFNAPARLTDQSSPNISDSFEFGDYNGLDVAMNDLIAIFTDNRNEGGGGGDSADIYAAVIAGESSAAIFADGFESGDTDAWTDGF